MSAISENRCILVSSFLASWRPRKKQKVAGQAHANIAGAASSDAISKMQRCALAEIKCIEDELKGKSNTPGALSLPQSCGRTLGDSAVVLGVAKDLLVKCGIPFGDSAESLVQVSGITLEPGTRFVTNPLMWDYVNEDTWWRGEPDVDCVLAFAKSMVMDEFMQTHVISVRKMGVPIMEGSHMGMLKHGPGAQRSLAACIALIAYMNAMDTNKDLVDQDFTHPLVVKSVSSLFAIPTIVYTSRGNDVVDRMVMVAQQNKDAKVEAVNSWQWYMMLKGLGCTAQQAVNHYNALPEVTSYSGGDNGSALEISIDAKRLYSIDGWLRKSTPEAHAYMTNMLKFESFMNIMAGDKHFSNPWFWVGSTADFAATSVCTDSPLPNEDSVAIDWTLPLSAPAHFVLLKRLNQYFNRKSMLVSKADKKKYRNKVDKTE